MTDNSKRDLWWEARQSHRPNRLLELGRMVIQSLPGRPAKQVLRTPALLGTNRGLAIDLNKYRANRNLKAYQDAGVDFFILRMGGPTSWTEGAWGYQLDATYRGYLEQLDALGLRGDSIGYTVHNPFELRTVNTTTGRSVHTQLIDEWTSGGYMPQAFVYDHEVAECWRGGTKITCTAPNLVESLKFNTANTWTVYKRMVGIYSARWFINSFGLTEHTVYFDNINGTTEGRQRPVWYAWYPQTYSKQYANLEDSLTDLLEPTQTQINNLLQCGSHSRYDLWQYTYTLKLTGDDIGVDANVTVGSKDDFRYTWGLTGGTTPPPPPPPPNTGEVTRAEFDALKLAHETHTHSTGAPVI